jgi:putative Holliday junction resolvase
MSRIISLDLGEKYIGIAMSDPMGIIAQPFCTIGWEGIEHLVKTLEDLIQKYDIKEIIVGIPYTLKGKFSDKTKEILDIKKNLEENLEIRIKEEDERFTTKMAKMNLIAMGKSPSRSKDKVNQLAAVFILQSYLERSNNKQ